MSAKRVILCGFVVLYTNLSICQSSYFLAKQFGNDNYICVTNSSSALSWIQKDIQEKFDYVTTYIPEQPPGEMNCNITDDYKTKNHFTKHPWKLRHSMQSEINYPILDERWEAMEVIKTEYVEPNYYKLKYELIKNVVPKESFNVPLSIRIENEGHIFLCDGEDPPKARCYWFMLQAFSGTGSAIRKCEKGYINSEHGTWPMAPCKEAKVYINHNIVPTYLSSKKWSHFVLSKQKNILKFTQISDHKENQIMEWRDDKSPIDVKNVIVHSKRNNGLWKIHNVDFLYTDVVSSDVNLGPLIYSTNRFICISMYVTMCSSCKLILSLAYGKHIITSKEFEIKHVGWTQIKFMAENAHSTNGIKLLVSTKSSDPKPFWAIDKVRLCRKKEVRVMALTEKLPCQLISESKQITYFSRYSQLNLNSNCPEDAIGDFCVPCNWIFEECEEITVCKGHHCVCSAGYQGEDCLYECADKTYGHGCQKQCGKCFYFYFRRGNCNYVNGKCLSSVCLESYSGPKCDIPPATIFAKSPEIIEISYTEATVRVSNFQLEHYGPYVTPQYYIIQYKTAEASDTNWRQVNDQSALFNMPQTFKITNLESETQYLVRSVIITSGNWQISNHLKTSNFTTRCKDISEGDINIEASNTTARIYLTPGNAVTCKSYTIRLFEQGTGFSNSSGTFFTNLEPYKSYTVKVYGIQKTIEKKFTTDEEVPTSVLAFTATAASATTADLKWTEPSSMNGAFKHYVVEYRHISYAGCKFASSEPPTKSRRETTDTFIKITDLIPFSSYEFTVFAFNTKFSGPPVSQNVTTLSSDTIQPKETPTIVGINTTHESVNIVLSKIKCENIRGLLIVEITTTCTSKWCQGKNREPRIDQRTLPNEAFLGVMQLEPFSEYDLELKFCRGTESCSGPQKKKFKTMTSVPRVVTDLFVYTKNESSISLRWKPPYPPTGILKDYKINYSNYRKRIEKGIVVPITPCTLWSELHCATLSDLPVDAYLTFKIYARNEDPDGYGPSKEVQTFVRIEKSKSPYNLVLNWTSQNHLQIEWKHPNETNGDVSYFGIQILNSTGRQNAVIDEQKLNVSRETYNLTYQYVVNGSALFPTTSYKVAVYAFNGEHGETTEGTTTSPPDVPTLSESKEPEFVRTNDSFKISVVPNKVRGSTDTYRLFVLKSDKQSNLEIYPSLQKYDLKNMKVVIECDVSQISGTFEIYIGSPQQHPNCSGNDNSSLQTGTTYNITIILQNCFKNESRAIIYSYKLMVPLEPVVANYSFYWFCVLLVLIPVVQIFGFKWHTKKNAGALYENHRSGNRVDRHAMDIPLEITKQIKRKNSKRHNTSGNLSSFSKIIERKGFQSYTKTSLDNEKLKHQHKAILATISAYECVPDTLDLEYVDMNYITGLKIQKTYAVTKIPTSNEYDEFWKTVWAENISHIILFEDIHTSHRLGVKPYWPTRNKNLYGDITVQCTTSEEHHLFKHRTFTIKLRNKSRKIDQLHFLLNSDDRCYLSSSNYVKFFQKMSKIPHSSRSPILVHSSSGMRGAGFALLCDMSLRTAAKDGAIDVVANLKNLTYYTSEMMVDFDHYVSAHTIIADCLCHLDTSIKFNEFDVNKQELFDKTEIQKHLQYLEDTKWLDRIKYEDADEDYMYCQAIFPKSADKIPLVPCTSGDADSCLKRFNVVKVYGFKAPKKFLVVQKPKANPLSDLLHLVQDERVTVVVTLKEKIVSWPSKNFPVMKINSDVVLEHQLTKNFETYDWITVKLTTPTASQTLEVISFKNWLAPIVSLPKPEDFTKFVRESNEIFKNVEIVLVADCGNVTASGLYIATTYIIQKIKNEGICDVCSSVRMLRRHSENFVVDKKHYMFLLEAAHNYLKEFSLYEVR